LRIGIIQRNFLSQPEVYAMLPLFEQLDPARFEVLLFTYVNQFGPMEEYCRRCASDMHVLPEDLSSQLDLLRSARLDVAVFGTNLTAECNVVTRLALHRIAPLQVAANATGITSGLPEIDLTLSGTLATTDGAAAQFTERLALMPGPTHTFNFEADRAEAQVACTRADFGLPEDAPVFVSTADFRNIIPEMQLAWARLLAAVPGAYLLVQPFATQEPARHTIQCFYAEFERVMQRAGVDSSRLVVSTVIFPSRTDLQSLVGLGDVYLDTFPVSGVDALVAPLALGLPVVGWEDEVRRSRTGGSLLRTLGLDELIAQTADGYQAIAVKLAGDSAYRESCRTRIRAELANGPAYLDVQKASQAFGGLMESAFDELVRQGRPAFRANPQPLRVAPSLVGNRR
jgi:predicted O-linked N-acetylglucosamine transferase (SPINDLY family)